MFTLFTDPNTLRNQMRGKYCRLREFVMKTLRQNYCVNITVLIIIFGIAY